MEWSVSCSFSPSSTRSIIPFHITGTTCICCCWRLLKTGTMGARRCCCCSCRTHMLGAQAFKGGGSRLNGVWDVFHILLSELWVIPRVGCRWWKLVAVLSQWWGASGVLFLDFQVSRTSWNCVKWVLCELGHELVHPTERNLVIPAKSDQPTPPNPCTPFLTLMLLVYFRCLK